MAALVVMETVHKKITYETTDLILMKRAMIQNSRWPSCRYIVKNIQTTSSPEPLGRFG